MKSPTKVRRTQPPEDPERGVARLRHVSEIASKLSSAVGPFGATVLAICVMAFLSVEFSRSDTAAIVIGAIAGAALLALGFERLEERQRSVRPAIPRLTLC